MHRVLVPAPFLLSLSSLVMVVAVPATSIPTQVLLRLFVKRSLATRGAEVVGLPFILRRPLGAAFIYFHATYGINCHFLPPSASSSIFLFTPLYNHYTDGHGRQANKECTSEPIVLCRCSRRFWRFARK